MRAEKHSITREYLQQLNASPFFIVLNYQGLKVGPISELRTRLRHAGCAMHVVKNSLFRLAVKETGIADLGDGLAGQLAVVTGTKDVSVAAKILKAFRAEFDKPDLHFGYLNNERLDPAAIQTLADLPAPEVLRARFLALLNTPAGSLVRLLNTPASQLARVLQAKADKT
ncbi:MAG: 50S ribosomal protein L10 [Verrucomicrobia bacterium]|nr:50S ribosomal protein L10 [Verrucomicrobiota bacterium]